MSGNEVHAGSAPDGRATRWDDHKTQRREAILNAAMLVVAEDGADASVRDIAQRAGVPRSVVYRVFTDRADLDEQLRVRILRDLSERLDPALDPHGTITEAIAFAVDSYIRWIVDYPRLHRFLSIGSRARREVGARTVTEAKADIATRVTGLAGAVLAANGVDTGLAESLAYGVVGLVDATVNRWLANPDRAIDADTLRGFLQSAIWNLIRGTFSDAGIDLQPTTSIAAVIAG